MQERRTTRSSDRDEAMGHLLGAVARAHGGRGIALVDGRGRLLAGGGAARPMWDAARRVQGRPTRRDASDGQGFVSRTIAGPEGSLTLAAIGVPQGASGMGRAAEGVARILGSR